MEVSVINSFCRRFDLAYIETGVLEERYGFWFLDFNNKRIFFTEDEILKKVSAR
jgi:hypothetical protein